MLMLHGQRVLLLDHEWDTVLYVFYIPETSTTAQYTVTLSIIQRINKA